MTTAPYVLSPKHDHHTLRRPITISYGGVLFVLVNINLLHPSLIIEPFYYFQVY